ncbi:MAG: class I SAM-dependent methyltransferase [Candidatus Sifarchaeia archaeon]
MRDAADGISGEYTVERDDGRVETLQVSYYIKPFSEWDELERQAIKHAKGRILDIGCGVGRVSLYLQGLGHEVVGIDLAPGAIEACKALGLIESYVMSVNNIEFNDGTFDTVVLYGNNFGIAGGEKEVLSMLRTLYRITSSEAIILAGSADALNTNNEDHLKYHEMNIEKSRPPGLVRIRVKYKEYVTDWSDLWLVTPGELKILAEKSGWKVDRIYQTGKVNQPAYIGILKKK